MTGCEHISRLPGIQDLWKFVVCLGSQPRFLLTGFIVNIKRQFSYISNGIIGNYFDDRGRVILMTPSKL